MQNLSFADNPNSSFYSCLLEWRGHYMAVKTRMGLSKRPGGGMRGCVRSFSAESRKRLLRFLASINLAIRMKSSPVVMITLTYPAEWPDLDRSRADLKAFLMVLRRYAPDASGVWRKEFQKRGAPHFHLLCFDMPYWKKDAVSAAWCRIIGGEARTRIEAIRSWRGVLAYAAKYLGKCEDNKPAPSAAGGAPRHGVGPAALAPRGLVNLAYQHASYPPSWDGDELADSPASEMEAPPLIGRQWGYFNKAALPLAPLRQFAVVWGEWQFKFRRYVRNYMGRVSCKSCGGVLSKKSAICAGCGLRGRRGRYLKGDRSKGFTVFTGDGLSWMLLALKLYHESGGVLTFDPSSADSPKSLDLGDRAGADRRAWQAMLKDEARRDRLESCPRVFQWMDHSQNMSVV